MLDLRPVEYGADAGEYAAADERGGLERHILGDLDGLARLDRRALGEDREVGEGVGRVALVRERLRELAERRPAHRRPALLAVAAVPAVAEGRQGDVVALLEVRDAGTDRLHDARALVPEDDRSRERDRPVDDREVGVAETGRGDADGDLLRARVARLDLVGDDGVGAVEDDRLHVPLLGCGSRNPSNSGMRGTFIPVSWARRCSGARYRRRGRRCRRHGRHHSS